MSPLKIVPASIVPGVVRHVRTEMDEHEADQGEAQQPEVDPVSRLPCGEGPDEPRNEGGHQERRPERLDPEPRHGHRAGRRQWTGHAHVADVLPVPKDRSHGEHRAKSGSVLPHEDDLLLEFAFLDGLPKEARDERRDVLRHMEHRDGHLADDLGVRPSEQLARVRRVLLHDPLHVTRDDGRLRLERLLGHGTLHEIEGPHVYLSSGLPVNQSRMKRLELTVPTSLLDDLEILSDRFFRHNRSVQVLQSFSVRPQTNALIVRVHRKGPFKDEATVRRDDRAIPRREPVARFELLPTDRTDGEYLPWSEWHLPKPLPQLLGRVGA